MKINPFPEKWEALFCKQEFFFQLCNLSELIILLCQWGLEYNDCILCITLH